MAKPKFELTADLVRVEPEPSVVGGQYTQPQHQLQIQPVVPLAVQKEAEYTTFANKPEVYLASQIFEQTNQSTVAVNQQLEIEREAISMKISKDLKKSFHLWCVQKGITMTDAIEAAIKKYLQE